MRRNAATQGITTLKPLPGHEHTFDPDLIPEIEEPVRSQEQDDIERVIAGLGIVDAYVKWCGKSVPDPGGKTESIMVSCPVPGHRDSNPSAWLNSDKETWFCGACQQGGDKYDLAAIHFGYGPSYKSKEEFPELRRKMAGELGYTVKRTAGGQETLERVEQEEEPDAEVIQMPTLHDPVADEFVPSIDWRSLFPNDTFMRTWMEQTSHSTSSEEYFVWLGLMAVGAAIGPDATLLDTTPVKGNLFTCLVGPSGAGKSRAGNLLSALLRRALPYDPDDPHSKGIKIAAVAASGEALIYTHQKAEYDPVDPKIILGYRPVRSLIQYEEMSDLLGRAARVGNSLKPILMEFYDAHGDITTDSRTSGQLTAAEPYAQFLSTTQTRALEGLFTRTDAFSGMLNRIVFAQGVDKPKQAIGGSPIDIEPAARPLMLIRTWASSGRSIIVSPGALSLLEEWFQSKFQPFVTGDTANPILARCDLLIKKLMLLFAANEHSEVVTEDIAARVLSLWPYIVGCYGVVEKRISHSDMEMGEAAERILVAIKEWQTTTGKSPSLRDLYERKLKRIIKDRGLMLRTLTAMVSIGEIEELVVKSANGKMTTRYKWAPSPTPL